MIHKRIKIPIYEVYLHILYGDLDDVHDLLVSNYIHQVDDIMPNIIQRWDENNTAALTINVGPDVIIFSNIIVDLPTLMHELLHSTFFICDNLGIRTDNSESFAYLFEFLFKSISKWYKVEVPKLTEADLAQAGK